jgi:hypothetical protein
MEKRTKENLWLFMRTLFLFCMLLALSFHVYAEDPSAEFYARSMQITNAGMFVLGGWAIGNMTVGAIGWSQNEGQRRYFHQMNFFWNTVNLGIAAFALTNNLNTDLSLLGPAEMMSRHERTQRILLINAFVDIGYMGTGILLNTLSSRSSKHGPRMAGYGNSVILQGAFLFVFDLVLYGLLRSHKASWAESLSLVPLDRGLGLAMNIPL